MKNFMGVITKKEFKSKTTYALLLVFILLMVESVQEWIRTNVGLSPFFVGMIGFLVVLYFFEVN